jgi:hypothetical protein
VLAKGLILVAAPPESARRLNGSLGNGERGRIADGE